MRAAFGLLIALAACGEGGLADQVAQDQAKRAVNPILAERFPGVPLEPATNCIIEQASASEILQLARAGATSPTADDTALVIEIATRPETLKCLLEEGLPPLLV